MNLNTHKIKINSGWRHSLEVKSMTTFLEGLDSVCGTYLVVHKQLSRHSGGIFRSPRASGIYIVHKYMGRQNVHTCEMIIVVRFLLLFCFVFETGLSVLTVLDLPI